MSDLADKIISEDGIPRRHPQLEKIGLEEAKNQLMGNILSNMGDDGSPSDFDVEIEGRWASFHAEWDRVRNPGQVTITAPSGAKATFVLSLK
jgi:hypothetical protein